MNNEPWKVIAHSINVGKPLDDHRWFYRINGGCEGIEETGPRAKLIAAAPKMEMLLTAILPVEELGEKPECPSDRWFREARALLNNLES